MTRVTSLACLLLVAACSRSTPPRARPAARAVPAATARPAPALAALPSIDEHEAEEQREIMNAIQGMSAYAPTAEGLRGFVAALAHESAAHDREGIERMEREIVADNARFDLAMDFEGARALRDRVVPTIEPAVRSLEAQLAALRAPLSVSVTSALGRELASGTARGFNPAMATVSAHLRGAVRYHRVEVTGADGGRVVIEPMAFLGGRWTWLGEPWTAVTPVIPAGPPAVGPTASR
ncbi:MAG: hypothetical protein U0326_25350 [Polyangiales bacterium]